MLTIVQQENLQNIAAGSLRERVFLIPDGRQVVASVSIKKFSRGLQQWGYLQFKFDKKSQVIYIGKVTSDNRLDSLRIGWELAKTRKVIERKGFTWLSDQK